MELLSTVVVCFIWFCVGWFLREYYAISRIKRMVKNLEEMEQTEEDNTEYIRISIEKIDETFFVYNTDDNNSFMAQGKTRKELEDALRTRYPNAIFACPERNLQEVGFK